MSDTYSNAETRKRAEEALKRMLATPPKPHKIIAPGIPKKPRKAPAKAKRAS